jgi:hypothetical protein
MSMDFHVCWQGERAVDTASLGDALRALGFEATILHDFNEAHGYRPIDMDGLRTGVEIYLDSDLGELRRNYEVLEAALEGRDRGATFVTHGDSAECGVGMALAAALARLFDGIMYEPIEGVIFPIERAVAEAKGMFESARKDGYRDRGDEEQT